MDHERYPYYFEDRSGNQGGIRAEHLEHARESFLAVASGIIATMRRLVTLPPVGQR
jgi:hypothetical protein